jgi:hypothetical protein
MGKSPPLANEKGAALIAAVVFVVFLTLFGMAFYQLGETDIPLVSHEEHLARTLYAADGGLERVSWLLKEGDDVADAMGADMNPFGPGYVEDGAISVANPGGGDFYPSGLRTVYFRIADLEGQGSKVRVRVLGAIDEDGDGEAGWPSNPDAQGFRIDTDDINRKIEAFLGLPGSLGDDLSAGAGQGFEDAGGIPISFESATFPFYGVTIPVLEDDTGNPGLILSDSIVTGDDCELPRGLFDESGNVIEDYFADCDKDEFSGARSFDGVTYAGKEIVLVTGDVSVSGNWQGKDVTVISTTQVTTTNDVACGFDGRLILIAPNVTLNGIESTRLNGIVVAGNGISLVGGGNPITSTDDAAVFVGTLVAGGSIRLQQPGWVIVFNQNVINGRMVALPTLTYDDMEDVDTLNMYSPFPIGEATVAREAYTSEEITNEEGDSLDLGILPNPDDGVPDGMKMVCAECRNSRVRLDLANGVFNDNDIDTIQDVDGYHNWTKWEGISFWMKLGNWQRTETTRTATILLTLTDANDLDAHAGINYTPVVTNPPVPQPYKVAEWRRITISFSAFSTPDGFDRSTIKEITFSYIHLDMDLTTNGRLEWSVGELTPTFHDPVDGQPYPTFFDLGFTPPRVRHGGPSGPDIKWYNETDVNRKNFMYKPAIAARMVIDRMELMGSPVQDWGLPACFQYDVSGWQEMP